MNPSAILTMLIGLGAVLGLLFVVVLILRRVPALKGLLPARAGQVHASLGVGPRERVVLVELGGEWLLLGVAPGRVNLLKTLDAQAAERFRAQSAAS